MPPNMDGYVGPSPLVNSLGQTPQDNNPTNEPPTTIKLERVPANSKFDCHLMHDAVILYFYHVQINLILDSILQRNERIHWIRTPRQAVAL